MLRHLAMTVGWAVGTLSLVGLSVGAEPVDIGSNRELMLDDHLFSSMQRLGFRPVSYTHLTLPTSDLV